MNHKIRAKFSKVISIIQTLKHVKDFKTIMVKLLNKANSVYT